MIKFHKKFFKFFGSINFKTEKEEFQIEIFSKFRNFLISKIKL